MPYSTIPAPYRVGINESEVIETYQDAGDQNEYTLTMSSYTAEFRQKVILIKVNPGGGGSVTPSEQTVNLVEKLTQTVSQTQAAQARRALARSTVTTVYSQPAADDAVWDLVADTLELPEA